MEEVDEVRIIRVVAPLGGEVWHAKFTIPDSAWERANQREYLTLAVTYMQGVMLADTPAQVQDLRWVVQRPLKWSYYPPTSEAT